MDAQEAREVLMALEAMNATLGSQKRKLECDLAQAQAELTEMGAELRGLDDKCKLAILDAAKLAEELRQEQEHAQHQERHRKALEVHVKVQNKGMDYIHFLTLFHRICNNEWMRRTRWH